jgi:hypothetical protein
MKKLRVIFFFGLLLSILSCGNNNKKSPIEVSDSTREFSKKSGEVEQQNHPEDKDIAEFKSPARAWQAMVRKHKGKPAGAGDTDFRKFLAIQGKKLSVINERHKQSEMNETLAESIVSGTGFSKEEKIFMDSLRSDGLAVEVGEGMSYVIRDWNFFSGEDLGFLSMPVRSFIIQRAKDQNEGFAKDASLTISAVQLVDRVIWWKKFKDENPNFILADLASSHSQKFLAALVYGTDNTPLLTLSKKLFEFHVRARDHLAKNYPRSPLARLLLPYYDELETDPASAKRKIKDQVKGWL